ncbi:hypothetical protein [Opitutus sp. ER46]|uniref:hypothetical protein n=1 Tax=Opitutus sp. ER46 TaxID=2161864 RepID=UPI000D43B514|nr:hypothetical protein [Opitutus sp. ER46]PTX97940.1 hypothetical protein DB354_06605 [Opitutus sp. ER46]
MKNILIVTAAALSAFAIAAFALSSRFPVDADSLLGYLSVFALMGLAALEYRIDRKRLLGR